MDCPATSPLPSQNIMFEVEIQNTEPTVRKLSLHFFPIEVIRHISTLQSYSTVSWDLV